MKKILSIKKPAGVFLLICALLLFPIAHAGLCEQPSYEVFGEQQSLQFDETSISTDLSLKVHSLYDYSIVWEDENPTGLIGGETAIDTNGDAIVVGINEYGNGRIVKYNGDTGGIIWDNTVTDDVLSLPGDPHPVGYEEYEDYVVLRDFIVDIRGQFIDYELLSQLYVEIAAVDTDSNNDVVIVATVYDFADDNLPSDVYVSKLDGDDGSIIWERCLSFWVWDFSSAIVVDHNDNVIIAGICAGIDFGEETPVPILDGFVYKFDGDDGDTIWADHIFGILQPFPYYLDVAVDTNNNIFAAGMGIIIDWSDFPDSISGEDTGIINKFGPIAHLLLGTYLGVYDKNLMFICVGVDQNDKVYAGGMINDPYTYEYVVKLSNDLETEYWEQTDKYQVGGMVMDIGFLNNNYLVTTNGRFVISQGDGDSFVTKVFTPAGTQKLKIVEGGDWDGNQMYAGAQGLDVDDENNVVVTGLRYYDTTESVFMYTMKYHITSGVIPVYKVTR